MIALDVLRGVALGVALVALVALASACVDLPPGVEEAELGPVRLQARR